MVRKSEIGEFLGLAVSHPVLDVRSPSEYAHAHIPGAYSLPLFSDEERKVVGTTYKQESRELAIKVGLDFFGVKMRGMVEAVEAICSSHVQPNGGDTVPNKTRIVLVHCWRGGMRSAAIAWLLDLYGFTVYQLSGGYKAYRNHVLDTFERPVDLRVIGGYTGSGKTELLLAMRAKGHKVIDLEALAMHRGSAFGEMQEAQPGQEYFENLLARQLNELSADNNSDPVWLEDESQRIGLVNLPAAFWKQMRQSVVFFLEVPFESRLDHILPEYSQNGIASLRGSITRIQKRLGGLDTRDALQFLDEGNTRECFRILLRYYDRFYEKSLKNRKNWDTLVSRIPCGVSGSANYTSILTNLWKTSKT